MAIVLARRKPTHWRPSDVSGAGSPAMNSTTTAASSSPLSSWRKWPPPTMVVCGWPFVPGMRRLRRAVGPAVIGSPSLKAHRNGRSNCSSTSQAARLAAAAGSSGLVGTSSGNWRAPSLNDSSGNGAS